MKFAPLMHRKNAPEYRHPLNCLGTCFSYEQIESPARIPQFELQQFMQKDKEQVSGEQIESSKMPLPF